MPLIDYSGAFDVKIDCECNEVSRILLNSNEQMEKTSTEEIKRLIRSVKPKKSAGFDQISIGICNLGENTEILTLTLSEHP